MSQILHNTSFLPDALPHTCLEAVDYIIENNCSDNFFLIVPTGKIVRYYQNEIVKKYYSRYDKPFSHVNIFTFQAFVKYCFDRIFDKYNYILISDAYRLALFDEASQMAGMKFFKKEKSSRMSYPLLKKLSEVVMGLKEDGVLPENIAHDISEAQAKQNKFKSDLNRLSDVYALYSAYQNILGDKLLDFPDLLRITTQKMNDRFVESFKKLFNKENIVLLDGFTEFKSPEVDFLRLFSKASIPFAVNVEYDDKEGPLYTILEKSINELSNAGFLLSNKPASLNSSGSKLSFLKHNLFNIGNIKDDRFSEIVKLIETPTIREEIHYITKLIKYLLIEKKYKASEICIALRQPNKYSPLFRESFYLNKIPVNISDRYQLDKSPVVVAVFAILDILNHGYRIDDLKKALKNPYISISDKERKPDIDNLINTAIKLRINKMRYNNGSNGWIERLEQKKQFLQTRLNILEDDVLADNFEIINLRNEIAEIEASLIDFKFIVSKMPRLKKKYRATEFADFLKQEIIIRFSIKNNIRNRVNIEDFNSPEISKQDKILILENIEKDSRAYNALIEIIDEMEFVLSDRQANKVFDIEELLANFRTSITGKKYQISEKSGFGVTVTTIEQTRQIPYKVLILCGAIEGEFPTPYKPEAFLGKELPDTEEKHILTERMQFFQFLANNPEMLESGKKRIFISYPKFSEEKELIRSPFVDALINITTLKEDDCIINISSKLNDFENDLSDDNKWIRSVSSNFEQQSLFGEAYFKTNVEKFEGNSIANDNQNLDTLIQEQIKEYLDFIRKHSYLEAKINKDALPAEFRDYFEKKALQPVSVSELEEYAKCPYKYFIRYILRLKEPEDVELSISPLEMGNILHRILFDFYTQIAFEQLENGQSQIIATADKLPQITPVSLNPAEKENYSARLIENAKSLLQQIKFDHPLFNIDEEMIIGSNGKGGLINIWLNGEMARIDKGWASVPSLFEFSFGMKSYNKLDSPVIELDGLKLKGKIDRIELNLEENVFLISDYKLSGKSLPGLTQVKQGKNFQLTLYLLAAKQILTNSYNINLEPIGAVYYIFKSKKEKGNSQFQNLLVPKDYKLFPAHDNRSKVTDSDTLNQLLNDSLASAKNIIEKIGNGYFDVAPDKDACTYCKFSSICRINKN